MLVKCACVTISLTSDRLGCIGQIFTLRQTLGHKRMFRRLTNTVTRDLKVLSDSVDRAILWCGLSWRTTPGISFYIFQTLYANSRGQVHAYGNLLFEFTTMSGVNLGCLLSSFFPNLSFTWTYGYSYPLVWTVAFELANAQEIVWFIIFRRRCVSECEPR